MVVVKNQDDGGLKGGQVNYEWDQDSLERRLRGLQRAQQALGETGLNGPQGGDKIGTAACRVIVALAQGEPDDVAGCARERVWGSGPTLDPITNKRGLAKTGGGRDAGQSASQALAHVEALDERGRATRPARMGGM